MTGSAVAAGARATVAKGRIKWPMRRPFHSVASSAVSRRLSVRHRRARTYRIVIFYCLNCNTHFRINKLFILCNTSFLHNFNFAYFIVNITIFDCVLSKSGDTVKYLRISSSSPLKYSLLRAIVSINRSIVWLNSFLSTSVAMSSTSSLLRYKCNLVSRCQLIVSFFLTVP